MVPKKLVVTGVCVLLPLCPTQLILLPTSGTDCKPSDLRLLGHHSKTAIFLMVYRQRRTFSSAMMLYANRFNHSTMDHSYRVIKRTDKHFTVDINGHIDTVSIDRLKSAYLNTDLQQSTLQPAHPTTPPCRTTRYGHSVLFPEYLSYSVQ